MGKGTFPLRDREIRGQELKWKRCTSNNHKYCLTASAVPWNQSSPFSPGVWVAAKTYIKWYSGQITTHLPAQQLNKPTKTWKKSSTYNNVLFEGSVAFLLHFKSWNKPIQNKARQAMSSTVSIWLSSFNWILKRSLVGGFVKQALPQQTHHQNSHHFQNCKFVQDAGWEMWS